MNSLSRAFNFAATTAAAIALSACAVSPQVNQTIHEPANPNPVVKINRCEDNGFLVADANDYNMAQVQQANRGYGRYNRFQTNRFRGSDGISSQKLNTPNGPKIIQYPQSFKVTNDSFSKVAGAMIGAGFGGGYGRAVGAAIGFTFLAPVLEGLNHIISDPIARDQHIKLAECINDLRVPENGAVPYYGGQIFAPRRN